MTSSFSVNNGNQINCFTEQKTSNNNNEARKPNLSHFTSHNIALKRIDTLHLFLFIYFFVSACQMYPQPHNAKHLINCNDD